MVFYDRQEDINRFKAVLSGEPNLVYFVYGPINSGKTALLMKVFSELSDNYRVFYINFRWRDVEKIEDLLQVLFEVRYGDNEKDIKSFVKDLLKGGAKVLGKLKGIPIPERIFDYLFRDSKKVEDVFRYLEIVFEEMEEVSLRPVFVLDEIQTIKEIVNESGGPVLNGLFNFLVGMTKERHLCHCLCSTSDCLFIEDIYSNARLEGRAKYILVDDLDKYKAFEVYNGFGFNDKDLVWEYVGGKIGDMVSLLEEKKQGYSEPEALNRILRDEVARLDDLFERIGAGNIKMIFESKEVIIRIDKVKNVLRLFKDKTKVSKKEIDPIYRHFLVQENLLFYNPVEGVIRSQSRLLQRAMSELLR